MVINLKEFEEADRYLMQVVDMMRQDLKIINPVLAFLFLKMNVYYTFVLWRMQ